MGDKYYWLKLKKDFFKRHDIQIIESMPNGKDYVLFYLKLLVESIDHNGELRFNETIPYSEDMLATITHTNIDIVHSAMSIFQQLDLIEILEDSTIYMQEVEKMLGSESKWAEKKRDYRLKKDNVLTLSTNCPNDVRQEIDIEIDKDIDKDKEIDKDINIYNNKPPKSKYGEFQNVLLADKERDKLQDLLGKEFNDFIERLSGYIESSGKKYKSHYATILNWKRKEDKNTTDKDRYSFVDKW